MRFICCACDVWRYAGGAWGKKSRWKGLILSNEFWILASNFRVDLSAIRAGQFYAKHGVYIYARIWGYMHVCRDLLHIYTERSTFYAECVENLSDWRKKLRERVEKLRERFSNLSEWTTRYAQKVVCRQPKNDFSVSIWRVDFVKEFRNGGACIFLFEEGECWSAVAKRRGCFFCVDKVYWSECKLSAVCFVWRERAIKSLACLWSAIDGRYFLLLIAFFAMST